MPDPNLRLALLHSLVHEGLVAVPDWDAVRRDRPYPSDTDDYDFLDPSAADHAERFQEACGYDHVNDEVRYALGDLLDGERAAWPLLTAFSWRPPADAIFACQPGWDGEDGNFDLTSLEGIDRFPGIRTVEVSSLFGVADLHPLAGLPVLESIDIDHAPKVTDWSALQRVASLRRVKAPVPAEAADRLAARGVEVRTPFRRHPLEELCPYEQLRNRAGRLLDLSPAERDEWVSSRSRLGNARKISAAEETVLARAWLVLADRSDIPAQAALADALLHLGSRLDHANRREGDAQATRQAAEITSIAISWRLNVKKTGVRRH